MLKNLTRVLTMCLTVLLIVLYTASPLPAGEEPLTTLQLLGRFQIPLSKAVSADNARNAVFTAKVIDKKVVGPGEVFSYGKAIGPITAKRGFVKGKVALPTRKGIVYSYSYGAGLCMTSSALYQAVKKAGLKTIERHNHAVETPYLKLGEDAAIWRGKKDYKFRNTKDNPIIINAGTEKGNLYITVSEIVPQTLPEEAREAAAAEPAENANTFARIADTALLIK